jgi:predicted unusual protein kinase regulating ubiquinone biosynthesis (AarF/ABC1/UbiB family)
LDKMSLSVELKKYKEANGAINFLEVLKIPSENRLVKLVDAVGLQKVHETIGAAITLAMESMNLSKPLSANQIFDLTDEIIDTASEDNLSIEDIVLFLQKMVRGETGEMFSTMDRPKFFKMFEKYRQERHAEYMRIKDEREAQYKCTPLTGRLSEGMRKTNDIDAKTFFSLLETYQDGKSENNNY